MKFIVKVIFRDGKIQNFNKDNLYAALETYNHFAHSAKVQKVELLLVILEGP